MRSAIGVRIALGLSIALGACSSDTLDAARADEDGNVPGEVCSTGGPAKDPCGQKVGSDGTYCAKSLEPASSASDLYTCKDGAIADKVACAKGCTPGATAGSDACAPAPDPCTLATLGNGYYCAVSLDPASSAPELYRCQDKKTQTKETCKFGCAKMPDGQSDVCNGDPNGPQIPPVTIDAAGMHFSAASVRPAIESGLAYELARLAPHVPGNKKVTPITIVYRPWNSPYCGGFATWDRTEISCPSGYPIQGSNQNYVVNITMHEIGHILAAQLFGSPASTGRNLCENEGIASWIAGKFWMNKYPAVQVSSLREAAKDDLARGTASLTMTNCVSAADGPYTVYASFFEYLQKNVPNGVRNVATGAVAHTNHVPGWVAWMK